MCHSSATSPKYKSAGRAGFDAASDSCVGWSGGVLIKMSFTVGAGITILAFNHRRILRIYTVADINLNV